MNIPIILVLICCIIQTLNAANILIMLPWPWYSHTNNYMPIFKELAKRGHNVTMVSPFRLKEPLDNFNEIIFPDLKDELLASVPEQNLVALDGYWFRMFGLWHLGLEWMKITLRQDVMKKLIEGYTNDKYDLVIVETWFIQEPFVAFGHKYNCPVINLAARFLLPQAAYLTGNDQPTAYVPVGMLPLSDRMTFLERIENTFHYYWDIVGGKFYYMRQQEALMREHFKYPGSENLPPLMDMLRNTSLTLVDYNSVVGFPAPFHKNVVEFGGINIKKADKLPADLQKFMDEAKDGVVYFSFGSYVEISLINQKIQTAIISAFGKLKQKVLMKLEITNPFINTTKSNTLVRQWFPQASILAHPNCKVFITHAGLHGVMEGLYYEVPMVAIPLFADQKLNGKFIETSGVGYKMDIEEVTEQNLLHAVNNVLNIQSYKENIAKRSAIFKDVPMNLLDHAVYWVEYVIRHKGAPHLRPSAVDLHWYQYLMLDVLAFYSFLLILIIYLIKFVLCMTFRIIKLIFCNKGKNSCKNVKKSKKE